VSKSQVPGERPTGLARVHRYGRNSVQPGSVRRHPVLPRPDAACGDGADRQPGRRRRPGPRSSCPCCPHGTPSPPIRCPIWTVPSPTGVFPGTTRVWLRRRTRRRTRRHNAVLDQVGPLQPVHQGEPGRDVPATQWDLQKLVEALRSELHRTADARSLASG
jgi:hypothetical protein